MPKYTIRGNSRVLKKPVTLEVSAETESEASEVAMEHGIDVENIIVRAEGSGVMRFPLTPILICMAGCAMLISTAIPIGVWFVFALRDREEDQAFTHLIEAMNLRKTIVSSKKSQWSAEAKAIVHRDSGVHSPEEVENAQKQLNEAKKIASELPKLEAQFDATLLKVPIRFRRDFITNPMAWSSID